MILRRQRWCGIWVELATGYRGKQKSATEPTCSFYRHGLVHGFRRQGRANSVSCLSHIR